MTQRHFASANGYSHVRRMLIDFRRPYQADEFVGLCNRHHTCEAESYHQPNCPKLAKDLELFKERRKLHEAAAHRPMES